MKTAATLLITKSAARASRWFGGGGGQALPGLIAEKIDPGFLRRLAPTLPHGVVLVTGSNGKTTTTSLLVRMLESSGERVITNATGSNLKRGIFSAFIGVVDWRGRHNFTMAVLEVDEASLRRVAADLQPRLITVLNLFRDQLDRYGELDTTAQLIGEGISQTRAQICLNADDPLVSRLSEYASDASLVSYFGIEGLSSHQTSIATATDSDRCPVCHERLAFKRVFYGHIGHYHCPKCGYKRTAPDVSITTTSEMSLDSSSFEVSIAGKRHSAVFALPGVYNLYNAIAALATAMQLGVSAVPAIETLRTSSAAFGRVERIRYRGRTFCLLLIKNPAGFAQVVQTFLMNRRHTSILLAINDLDADGRDVSWLWDVPIEVIRPFDPLIWAGGLRAGDMSVRLKYAEIPVQGVVDYETGINALVDASGEGDEVYILPTYTAMNQIRKQLAHMVRREHADD